ncbi:PREDICTED: F-box protein At4g19940-like [Nicotiana attenuata]|uniref:F-box associated beta-propeller type 3 domain-containing protein n=1 Tax=Nicotiana attenuata TaxID=49451 RepID=A0A1J6I8M3_NICAT|nr:PREDICTED: F-box protein At4g19940-like [Nicotiana attenuata]OIS96895.1 hypothetical protein A4A49_53764 [Nicotiana attenuata]
MDHKVSLFHISTCEVMNLPLSSLNLELTRRIWYALGFDPIDNVYKLLKLCLIQKPDEPHPYRYRNRYDEYGLVCDNEYELVCEILTLETSLTSKLKWREIDVSYYLSKFSCVKGQSYYVNGVIFWKFCTERTSDEIVAFDVHKENFTTIELPRLAPTRRFGQYGGNLALSYTHTPSYDPWILDIWVLENHEKTLWTKVTINLPKEVQKYFDEATPIGNFPSGELLLLCFERQKMEGTFFTYDAIKKKFTKLMIELPRSLALARRTGYPAHMSCLFDNIMFNNAALDNLF